MRVAAGIATIVCAAALCGPAAAITNPQVPGLQVALQRKGFDPGPIDGIAGPQTRRAMRAFQRSVGLVPDGLPGPRTRRALGRLARPTFRSRVLARGAIGLDVSVTQFFLARLGFAPPRLNGNFGAGTERAVRRFQRWARIPVDGVVGPVTQKALLLPPGTRPRAPRGVTYRVRAGDTLTLIALRYGTTLGALVRTNRLDPKGTLLIGTRLLIPRPRAGASAVDVRGAIDRWARHYGVDALLARALAYQESGFQPEVRSPMAAFGVMQVTPPTWSFVELFVIGLRVPRTTDGNIRVGVAYLAHLLRLFRGSERLALAAYYQGPASVRERGLLRETRAFVANVLALRGRV